MSKIVFPSLILYKVESVRNKDLNLKELQQLLIVYLFLYLVRQCAKKRGRKKANHLLTLTLMPDVLAFLEILDNIECL